jgi:hypothetical protein
MDSNDVYDPDTTAEPYEVQYTPGIPTKGNKHNGKLSTLVAACHLVDPLVRHHPTRPFSPHLTSEGATDLITFSFLLASVKQSSVLVA